MKLFSDETLAHYGIPGQKKGVRRWQYEDGHFNEEGKIRYFGYPKRKKTLSDIKNEVSGGINNFDYSTLIYGSLIVGAVIGGAYLYNKYGINSDIGKLGTDGIFKLNKPVKDIISLKDSSLNMNITDGHENCRSNALAVQLNNIGVIDGTKYRSLSDDEMVYNNIWPSSKLDGTLNKIFKGLKIENIKNINTIKDFNSLDIKNKTGFLEYSYNGEYSNRPGHIIPVTKGMITELQYNKNNIGKTYKNLYESTIQPYIEKYGKENEQLIKEKLDKVPIKTLKFYNIENVKEIDMDFVIRNNLLHLL